MENTRIFISHSTHDVEFCRNLVAHLRKAGADVWYDEHNLGTGQLTKVISKQLDDSSILIAILTPAAIQSPWVEQEVVWFNTLKQSDTGRILVFVPIKPIRLKWLRPLVKDGKYIASGDGKPYPQNEAIFHTLKELGLLLPENLEDFSYQRPQNQRKYKRFFFAPIISSFIFLILLVLLSVFLTSRVLPISKHVVTQINETATAQYDATYQAQYYATVSIENTAAAEGTIQAQQTTDATYHYPTATAVAQIHPQYQTTIPGVSCDSKGAQWTIDNALVNCESGKMQLVQGSEPQIGFTSFFGLPSQQFSANISVSVTISGISNYTCAGILLRGDTTRKYIGGYGFLICDSGEWEIMHYLSDTGQPDLLLARSVQPANSYTLIASSIGMDQTLYINHQFVGTVSDGTYATGNHVELTVDGKAQDSASFSDFSSTFVP